MSGAFDLKLKWKLNFNRFFWRSWRSRQSPKARRRKAFLPKRWFALCSSPTSSPSSLEPESGKSKFSFKFFQRLNISASYLSWWVGASIMPKTSFLVFKFNAKVPNLALILYILPIVWFIFILHGNVGRCRLSLLVSFFLPPFALEEKKTFGCDWDGNQGPLAMQTTLLFISQWPPSKISTRFNYKYFVVAYFFCYPGFKE